ncbi:hypothetical protein E2562_034070 [Oryza meyeriana var. granulata]|uniref:Uncharacterized protein n=1 Tax=Oryza meyeriana var. granulata TaxID=110450 RepID=A0A6G1DSG3_9ORYZ|nr:hypothetical protein E2562_034070 [Oryza meyeriana var. granulata]
MAGSTAPPPPHGRLRALASLLPAHLRFPRFLLASVRAQAALSRAASPSVSNFHRELDFPRSSRRHLAILPRALA